MSKKHLFNVIWGWKDSSWNVPVERVMIARRTREQSLQYIESYFSSFGDAKALNYWEAPGDQPNTIQYVKIERCSR